MIQTMTFGTENGTTVSSFCLGCLNFGTKTPAAVSFSMLDMYYEAGGSFLDTANNYAFWEPGAQGGESESIIGTWLNIKQNRSKIFLATKAGALPRTKGGGFDALEGLSAAAVTAAVEKSLHRLKTDYIDLLYAHIDDTAVPLKETLEAFARLIKAGKIRSIGCSNYSAARLQQSICTSNAHQLPHYECIQTRFSYLVPLAGADFGVQKAADAALETYCTEKRIQMLAYSPLLGGFYNKGIHLPAQYGLADSPRVVQQLAVLRRIAEELHAVPTQIVLAWLTQRKNPIIPLIAAGNLQQLTENIQAAHITLLPQHIEELENARADAQNT